MNSATLTHQIERSSFERTMLADLKLAPPVRELHQDVVGTFKDTYLLDFLNLPEPHLEADLQAALLFVIPSEIDVSAIEILQRVKL